MDGKKRTSFWRLALTQFYWRLSRTPFAFSTPLFSVCRVTEAYPNALGWSIGILPRLSVAEGDPLYRYVWTWQDPPEVVTING